MNITVSIGKAARYLGKSPSHLRELHDSNILVPDAFTAGGHRRYSIESLDRFLEAVAHSGNCAFYSGIPDVDFPAHEASPLKQRCYQILMGMGLIGLEDITPAKEVAEFYMVLPDILETVRRPDITRLAIARSDCIPTTALAVVLSTASVFGTQVFFLNLR